MRWTRSLVVVYANVALYALCFQLQRPIEPFLVEKLGAKGSNAAMSYGALQSFFSIMQTVGSLAMGVLLDKLGARSSFVICYASSAASYWLMSISTSLPLLYLSKVPTFFQAGFLVAQALIAQETSGDDRAAALGRATAAYTIGATAGPLMGGWLGASGNYYLGAKLAVAGSLLSVALSLLLPAGHVGAKDEKEAQAGSAGIAKMLAVAMRPAVVAILATKLGASVGSSMKQSVFPLVLKDGFGVAEGGMGVAMSVTMVVNSLVGAFVIGPFTNKFKPRVLVPACILAKACCEAAIGLVAPGSAAVAMLPDAVHASLPFAGCFVLGSTFQFALATTLSVLSTSAVGKDEQGSLMGVEHAMFSGARIGTPTLAAYLFSIGGVPLVAGTCTSISLCLLLAVRALVLPRYGAAEKGR
mmetsp:Transcript_109948/g.355031  ORF Transcript_109948/g.355031 Transcript_109948/m.355031 type:complete len:414 (+) Transcript_109948:135-1376(+)